MSSLTAGLLGIPLTGYTAVLIANTAVPLWHEARTSLPALFMGSAMTSAAQVLKLLPVKLPRQARSAINTFGIAGSLAELAAGSVVEQQVNRVAIVGKALDAGLSGVLAESVESADARWTGPLDLRALAPEPIAPEPFWAQQGHRPAVCHLPRR